MAEYIETETLELMFKHETNFHDIDSKILYICVFELLFRNAKLALNYYLCKGFRYERIVKNIKSNGFINDQFFAELSLENKNVLYNYAKSMSAICTEVNNGTINSEQYFEKKQQEIEKLIDKIESQLQIDD